MAPDLMADPGPFDAAVRKAVEEEREACCRAVCVSCAHGFPTERMGSNRLHIHRDSDGNAVPCDAAAIRRRGEGT